MPRELSDMWTIFADTSCRVYSPLYDRIARAVAASDDVLAVVGEAPPRGHLPTSLLAAVHYLVLGEGENPLAALYQGRSDVDPGPLFVEFCLQHRDEIVTLLSTRHTNTNEVGRSALIGPALTAVSSRLGGPLGLVDVGCSAGLNLLCDRYLLDYGPAGSTGAPDAAVRVTCDVVGGRPPIADALPPISHRVGVDRDPVDVTDADDVRWQLACVWPDTGRLARTRRALEEVRHAALPIVRGDAVEAVGGVVRALPADLVATVITTWTMAYLLPDERAAFHAALADAATGRPVAWIVGEGPEVVEPFSGAGAPQDAAGTSAHVLGLIVFDDGAVDASLLGFVQPHGNWIDWRAD
jgi:hypothetical protein